MFDVIGIPQERKSPLFFYYDLNFIDLEIRKKVGQFSALNISYSCKKRAVISLRGCDKGS